MLYYSLAFIQKYVNISLTLQSIIKIIVIMKNKGEIILYHPEVTLELEVRIENETAWLNRHQLSELFKRDIKTISKHINNALKEELKDFPVVAKFATTASDGKIYNVEYYNLDMVISIGYRVKSQSGIRFRIWANKVLKEYLLKGYAINQRIENIEAKLIEHDQKIDFFVKTSLPPAEGIFYNGQLFDAYKFASDLIRTAHKSIILIDNYIDDTVLLLLTKRNPKVTATIYTTQISKQLALDIQKHNSQYEPIDIRLFKQSHDRFLLIDNKDIYHIGASLKDLGKKWFAFSKLNLDINDILNKLI